MITNQPLFGKAGVEFVIVEGFADVFHGCKYVTLYIDICCDFAVANLLTLQATLSYLDPVHRMTPGRKKPPSNEQTSVRYVCCRISFARFRRSAIFVSTTFQTVSGLRLS